MTAVGHKPHGNCNCSILIFLQPSPSTAPLLRRTSPSSMIPCCHPCCHPSQWLSVYVSFSSAVYLPSLLSSFLPMHVCFPRLLLPGVNTLVPLLTSRLPSSPT